jgi:hypothetical protein
MKSLKTALNIICFWLVMSVFCYGFAKFTQAVIINSTINSTTIGATTPSTGSFTGLGITSGLTNAAGGAKHQRGTTCTTAAGTNGECGTTVTWGGGGFVDTNYTWGCTVESNAGTVQYIYGGGKTATAASFQVMNTPGNTGAASGTYDCWAFHDN